MDRTSQRMVGANVGTNKRAENDFYPTPPQTTQTLLDRVKFNKEVWEPACGEGDMSEVLMQNGYEVFSSDLVDRGYRPHSIYPFECIDFLQYKSVEVGVI